MKKRRSSMILAILMVIAVALTATGCGSGGAKDLVKDFFESIDKQDVKKFLKCFDKDTREDLEDYFEDQDELEVLLDNLDLELEDQQGEKWIKKLKIGDVEKEDTEDEVTYYTVEVEMDDEEVDFPVIKIKGKFYIGHEAMNLF